MFGSTKSLTQSLDTKIINEKYVILLRKVLGSGSFATVYKGYLKNNVQESIAIKMVSGFKIKNMNEDQNFKFLQRELEIQKKLISPHIVKMQDVVKCDQCSYIILEYCDQGNLATMLNSSPGKKIQFENALKIFSDIVKGYQELYKEKVIHRDLKPENILFKDGIAKIADFGFAKIVDEMELEGSHTQVGTLQYCAPELMQGLKFSSKVDVWSLGCILYEMLYGKTPFNEYNPQKLFKKITTSQIEFPQDNSISEEIKILVKRMLQPNPENRIRWDEIFTNKFIEIQQPQSNADVLSQISTQLDDQDRVMNNQQQRKNSEQSAQKAQQQLLFYSNINSFINQTIRQFYQFVNELKISKELQMLISTASSKYIVIDTQILKSILQSNQQDQCEQQCALKQIDRNDVLQLRQSINNQKYSEILNCLNNQSATLIPFLENLKQNFKKIKQLSNNNFQPQNIQKIEEMLNTEIIDNQFIENYNYAFKQCIKDCIINKSSTKDTTQITKCIIQLCYCLQPFQFDQGQMQPKILESKLYQYSQKELDILQEKLLKDLKITSLK